ncbi:MAG: epoxyqueuosine reductase [Candidatus Methanoperedenaceae archaeon]|nr:MAG: epoxyqueuosine reductase [Candidatus Methanoperedenaceae archaeon]
MLYERNKNLNQQLQNIISSNGVDYLGIADLSQAHNAILEQGGSLIASFPFSISIGISILDSIVDLLPQRNEKAVKVSYRHHVYDIVNLRLDLAASIISSHLQQSGARAFPIPASKRVDDERICASFSHKLSAHLAGLGWIGKSCLLITPEHGPRVRWATILTDAPLESAGEMQKDQCGDCRECIDICPTRAFTGKPFRTDEPREARYDVKKCEKYFDFMEQKNEIAVCGMCVFVCPYGRKKKI